jgi:hypothetical protein
MSDFGKALDLDQFFKWAEPLRSVEPSTLYVVDLKRSSKEKGVLCVSRISADRWFGIPLATIETLTPLNLESDPSQLVVSLVLKKEYASLIPTFDNLAHASTNGESLLSTARSRIDSFFTHKSNQLASLTDAHFNIRPLTQLLSTETPPGTKLQGNLMRVQLPGAYGGGAAGLHVWYTGSWEATVAMESSNGTGLGEANNNAAANGLPKNRDGFMFPLPVPSSSAADMTYTVHCSFKRGVWRPDLPWEPATVCARATGYNFAWWYPEDPTHYPEPPSWDAKDGWFVIAAIVIA